MEFLIIIGVIANFVLLFVVVIITELNKKNKDSKETEDTPTTGKITEEYYKEFSSPFWRELSLNKKSPKESLLEQVRRLSTESEKTHKEIKIIREKLEKIIRRINNGK